MLPFVFTAPFIAFPKKTGFEGRSLLEFASPLAAHGSVVYGKQGALTAFQRSKFDEIEIVLFT